MDWRANGDVIRDRMRCFLSAHAVKDQGVLIMLLDGSPSTTPSEGWIEHMPVEWLKAGFSEPYDPARFDIRQWFRAHPNLTDYENDPLKNGRPIAEASRAAATLALSFYETWRRENEKAGVSDYGHRGEMKDFAARAIVEDIYALQFDVPKLVWQFAVDSPAQFVETIRELMDKPKRRREPDTRAHLDYLASPSGLVFDLPPKPPSKS